MSGTPEVTGLGADAPTIATGFGSSPGSAPDSDAWGRFTPGTLFAGRFRIVAPLGRGGMGEVYRADDLPRTSAASCTAISSRRT